MLPPDIYFRAVDGERKLTKDLLKDPNEPRAPLKVALTAYRNFESTAASRNSTAVGPGLACSKGCSWCCRGIKVEVTATEAITIAEYFRSSLEPADFAEFNESLQEAATESRALDAHQRHVEQHPCFFLDEETGECGIYDFRPMRCRGHTSLDAAVCERACKTPDDASNIPTDGMIQQISSIFTLGQDQAFRELGYDGESYELVSAVAVAANSPDVALRWMKGERVLAAARLPSDAKDRADGSRQLVQSIGGEGMSRQSRRALERKIKKAGKKKR